MGYFLSLAVALMVAVVVINQTFLTRSYTELKENQVESQTNFSVTARSSESESVAETISQETQLLTQICRTLWIEMRRNKCPNADDVNVLWSFLPNTEGKILDVVNSCTSSSVFDCTKPEEYGCYLLKKYSRTGKLKVTINGNTYYLYYDKTGIYQTTDPCAFVGLIKIK